MTSSLDWAACPVLVTGGASFIGSHLVDELVRRGAQVRVVDDLSSGSLANLEHHIRERSIDFRRADLLAPGVPERSVEGIRVVFHLAADHGGRGYVDLNQAACAMNLVLDGLVFRAARAARVERVVYASSGCVYPDHLQRDPDQVVYLSEEKVGPPYDADNMYGWAKLMGEMTLRAFHREWGMRGVSCRYFTVYGERGHENHAIMAMIARAFVQQDPFVIWGTGEQIRNWTYVGDIVAGTLLAAERIDDASAVNLGSMERVRVIDAAREVLRLAGREPRIAFRPDMPTGPLNRVADNSRARILLGWVPKVSFREGVRRTLSWYFATRDRATVSATLEWRLTHR